MSNQTSELAKMRLMLQAQQTPSLQLTPVQDIGGGVSQGAHNIVQQMMQRRNQQILQEMLAQEQKAAADAQAAKVQGLTPIAQQLGMDVNTLMALPDAALTQLTGKLYENQQKTTDLQDKADALRYSLQTPQEVQNLDETGRIPLEMGVGMGNLDEGGRIPLDTGTHIANMPIMSPEQSQNLVRTGGDKPLIDAMALLQADQLKQQLAPIDTNSVEGINQYTRLYGGAPVTQTDLAQKNANLAGTLLGNKKTGIEVNFLPSEKKLGLLNSGLDATGKQQDQYWKPILNTAGVESTLAGTASTKAGTTGKLIGNERDANSLMLETRVMEIMSQDDIPLKQRIGAVSLLSKDPKTIIDTLKGMSGKEGLLGIKPKDLQESINIITRETGKAGSPAPAAPKPQPKATPKPAAYQAGQLTRAAAKGAVQGVPILGPALNYASTLRTGAKQFGDAVNATQRVIQHPLPTILDAAMGAGRAIHGLNQFGAGLFGGQPAAPTPAPAQPVTLPGIRNAKTQAQGKASAANGRIVANSGQLQQNNSNISALQALLDESNRREAERKAQLQKVFVNF